MYLSCFLASSFQSTPSAWRETPFLSFLSVFLYISIHSLRMEGDDQLHLDFLVERIISIHSLRMEGDQIVLYYFVHPYISIHSLRMEGDVAHIHQSGSLVISIHSLRMEGDFALCHLWW